MKKLFKILLALICLITALNIFGLNVSEAKAKTNSSITSSAKGGGLIFIRVQEGHKFFIHVYTDGGNFVMKFEEL